MKLHLALLISALAILAWELTWFAFAPYGYEDESGFHELTPDERKEIEHEDY